MSDYIKTKVDKYIVKKYLNGEEHWYFNEVLHRENGPAVKSYYGYDAWYKNGELHREDGPAIKFDQGAESWYLNGKHHRVNGPAIKYSTTYQDYYLNNVCILQKEYKLISISYRINIIYESIY